jgi:hypothetical protein
MSQNASNCICHNGYDLTCPVHRNTEKSARRLMCGKYVSPFSYCRLRRGHEGECVPATQTTKPTFSQSDLDAATKPLKAEIARLRNGIESVLDAFWEDRAVIIVKELESLLAKPETERAE